MEMIAAMSSSHLLLYPISNRRSHFFRNPRFCQTESLYRFSFRLGAAAGSDYEREEVRWIREEQRWKREENRWQSEREALLREISELKLRFEGMEIMSSTQGTKGVAETIANLASVLQVLKEADYGAGGVGRIAETGAGPSPIVLEAVESEKVVRETEEEKEEIVLKEIRVVESEAGEVKKVKRKVLKVGAEGEEVRALQSSVGATEDGIMTSELLEWLYSEQSDAAQLGSTAPPGILDHGVAFASVTKISEVQMKVVTEKGASEVGFKNIKCFFSERIGGKIHLDLLAG